MDDRPVHLWRLIRHWTRDPEGSDLRAQRTIHTAAGLYLRFVRWLGVLRVTSFGMERIDGPGPRIVATDHPTLFDIVVLCSRLPQVDCIVNSERAENFFLRRMSAAAGCVRNDGAFRS